MTESRSHCGRLFAVSLVLLKGISDDLTALIALIRSLLNLGKGYYFHHKKKSFASYYLLVS